LLFLEKKEKLQKESWMQCFGSTLLFHEIFGLRYLQLTNPRTTLDWTCKEVYPMSNKSPRELIGPCQLDPGTYFIYSGNTLIGKVSCQANHDELWAMKDGFPTGGGFTVNASSGGSSGIQALRDWLHNVGGGDIWTYQRTATEHVN